MNEPKKEREKGRKNKERKKHINTESKKMSERKSLIFI